MPSRREVRCRGCGELFAVTDLNEIRVCGQCDSAGYRTCPWCLAAQDNVQYTVIDLSEAVCGSCVRYCRHCDEPVVDRAEHEYMCEERAGLPNGTILNYSYKPVPQFFGKAPNKLFFGVEHEVELEDESMREESAEMVCALANQREESRGLLYVKEDSTLTSGIEIVSHPMSFDFFHEFYPFKYMDELETYDSNSAGIHIHMSSAAFKQRYHLMRFLMFHFNEGKDLAIQIAGRESHWGSFDMSGLSRQRWQKIADAKQQTGRLDWGLGNPDRYLAVNIQPDNTCELRYFKSTVEPSRFKAYLQFADAVYKYTHWARVKPRAGEEKRLMDVGGFLWWLDRANNTQPERYGDLTALIDSEVTL